MRKYDRGDLSFAKVTTGVVVAAVIGLTPLFSPGSTHPTAAQVVGQWKAQGVSNKDQRTYVGLYDFYANGKHTYDIILNNGVERQGRGVWTLTEGTNTLQVKNDTGSVYVGMFDSDNFTTIAMITSDNNWGLILKKK